MFEVENVQFGILMKNKRSDIFYSACYAVITALKSVQSKKKNQKGGGSGEERDTKKKNAVCFIMASLHLYDNDSAVQLLHQHGYNNFKNLTLCLI